MLIRKASMCLDRKGQTLDRLFCTRREVVGKTLIKKRMERKLPW